MRVVAKIEGLEELVQALVAMGASVEQALEAATQAGAWVIAQASNGYAPLPLIRTETVKRQKRRVEVDIGPPDDKWYWKFMETGAGPHEIPGPLSIEFEGELRLVGGASHPGMGANPFLRPAFDTRQGAAVDAVGTSLRKVIEK